MAVYQSVADISQPHPAFELLLIGSSTVPTQQLEDELVFSWEGHRPLVSQMKQLIMANSELQARQEKKTKHPPETFIFMVIFFFFQIFLSGGKFFVVVKSKVAPLVQEKLQLQHFSFVGSLTGGQFFLPTLTFKVRHIIAT